jgi:hypothetical protein
LDDLRNAIGQQVLKDSRLQFSKVGIWTAGFTDWQGHDPLPSEMLQYYFHQIKIDASSERTYIVDLLFNWHKGDQENVMLISRDD